jgi:hypothetical protein
LEIKYWKLRQVGYVLLGCIQGVGNTKKVYGKGRQFVVKLRGDDDDDDDDDNDEDYDDNDNNGGEGGGDEAKEGLREIGVNV